MAEQVSDGVKDLLPIPGGWFKLLARMVGWGIPLAIFVIYFAATRQRFGSPSWAALVAATYMLGVWKIVKGHVTGYFSRNVRGRIIYLWLTPDGRITRCLKPPEVPRQNSVGGPAHMFAVRLGGWFRPMVRLYRLCGPEDGHCWAKVRGVKISPVNLSGFVRWAVSPDISSDNASLCLRATYPSRCQVCGPVEYILEYFNASSLSAS